MERRQIRELIGRFLHNDVPGELQTQFRRWMLQPGDGDEKEAALREEWTAVVESPAAADRSEELQRLRHTIRMREAQQRPQDFAGLVVRVAGYSAFFVELSKEIQDDIIRRTAHQL